MEIKIRADLNEIENKKTKQKLIWQRAGSLERLIKLTKLDFVNLSN